MQCLPLDQQKVQPCGTEYSRRPPFSLSPLSPGVGALKILADQRGGKMEGNPPSHRSFHISVSPELGGGMFEIDNTGKTLICYFFFFF